MSDTYFPLQQLLLPITVSPFGHTLGLRGVLLAFLETYSPRILLFGLCRLFSSCCKILIIFKARPSDDWDDPPNVRQHLIGHASYARVPSDDKAQTRNMSYRIAVNEVKLWLHPAFCLICMIYLAGKIITISFVQD